MTYTAAVDILGLQFRNFLTMRAMKPRITVAKKIGLIWFASVVAFYAASLLFPHDEIRPSEFIAASIQLLLFVLCVFIGKREPVEKNKFIFINFAAFFGLSIVFYLYYFVGTIFPHEPFAKHYFIQYVSLGAYFFFLALAIVYLAIDTLFRDYRVFQKYVLALAIVGGFFGYYYHSYVSNPKHLYETADILDWKMLDEASEDYRQAFGALPTPEKLAETTEMFVWKDGRQVGVLFASEKQERVAELYPYLAGLNYQILLLRPIYYNTIYMCVVCIGFILLYFGYQYKKDPPQGAYIEKIMFLFLLFCSLEVLHAWSFIKTLEWQTFSDLTSIGNHVSTAILLLIALSFGLRLRFITSPKGEFYEQEIISSPGGITRWRDALDNIMIRHFFNPKSVMGRMFVDPRRR